MKTRFYQFQAYHKLTATFSGCINPAIEPQSICTVIREYSSWDWIVWWRQLLSRNKSIACFCKRLFSRL